MEETTSEERDKPPTRPVIVGTPLSGCRASCGLASWLARRFAPCQHAQPFGLAPVFVGALGLTGVPDYVMLLARVIGGDKVSVGDTSEAGYPQYWAGKHRRSRGSRLGGGVLALLLSVLPSRPRTGRRDRWPPLARTCLCAEDLVEVVSEGRGPGRYECATARVPLSYQNPDGKKISLALGMLPATDQKRRSARSSGTSAVPVAPRASRRPSPRPCTSASTSSASIRGARTPALLSSASPPTVRPSRRSAVRSRNPEAGSAVLRGQRARHASVR